jgi:hypothetical protein
VVQLNGEVYDDCHELSDLKMNAQGRYATGLIPYLLKSFQRIMT